MTNYSLLILVNILSFLSIRSYDFYPEGPYDRSLDNYRLLTPGVLFSIYIIFIERRNLSYRKLILFFFLLFALYYISLMTGCASWGVAVPLIGGVGAFLMRILFNRETEWYFTLGFAAGLVGLALYYLVQATWTSGFGFGLILISWQFIIGMLWIKQNESKS